eukprot:m.215324 g.215324  ORF g.215324 m.215324 type:complete len:144 (+) comp33186_c2_seq12:159-590(+)
MMGAMFYLALLAAAFCFVTGQPRSEKQWLGAWSVVLDDTFTKSQLETIAARHGFEVIGNVSALEHTYFLHPLARECGDHRGHCRGRRSEDIDEHLLNENGILHVTQQHEIQRDRRKTILNDEFHSMSKREWSSPRDPLFGNQW